MLPLRRSSEIYPHQDMMGGLQLKEMGPLVPDAGQQVWMMQLILLLPLPENLE